ncbi:Uncharacterized protein C18orf8, partial [Eschrichtius robustus]|nr:Uncharacterized protein C18orf8 [Eschrichtius robustus]
MEDKGEVKCIKFSLENKILAVQRTSKTVDFSNFTPDSPQLEYTQECKTKNANILGFCWTSSTEIVFITDQGIEFYQVLPEKRNLKLLKSQNINVNWYMYCPESAVILLSTTVLGNVLQPFYFRAGTMSKLPKFEIELPAAPKSTKLSLSERDIAMATMYVCSLREFLLVIAFRDIMIEEACCKNSRAARAPSNERLLKEVLSVTFYVPVSAAPSGCVTSPHTHASSLFVGPAPVTSQSPIPCKLYSSSWIVFQPDIIISASQAGQSRSGPLLRRPARTQAVVDQSDMYTHVLSAFTEKKEMPQKFVVAVLMEYIRSLNQFQITVQHYLHELVIKTLVQHNLFYTLHQFLQYHVLSDSKPLACLLLSLESFYPPAHQLSLDMLKRLSTANDEIVEVLLSKHQVLAALRFIRGIGGHDNISARKFLDAAKQTEDRMLFYTIFRFFEQRNQRLRGNPSFTPGEHCEEHVAFFKQVFGDQALMRPMTF